VNKSMPEKLRAEEEKKERGKFL